VYQHVKTIAKRYIPREKRQQIRAQFDKQHTAFRRSLSLPLRRLAPSPYDTLRVLYDSLEYTPENVIHAYSQGLIEDKITSRMARWDCPPERWTLPIAGYQFPRAAQQRIQEGTFRVVFNANFTRLFEACINKDRRLSVTMQPTFETLHEWGSAHSVEVYQADRLVGGLIGCSIGGFFTHISHFQIESEAANVALAYTCAGLQASGFILHDVRFVSEPFEAYKPIVMRRELFMNFLPRAVAMPVQFKQVEVEPAL
jgi:leucyl/phenylalanyl-tRNA--protein transferase